MTNKFHPLECPTDILLLIIEHCIVNICRFLVFNYHLWAAFGRLSQVATEIGITL